jgi:hypothetical protein
MTHTRTVSDTFWRTVILPEEDRRALPNPPLWNGSYRWFRSANIIDLWGYRDFEDKLHIIDRMWERQHAAGFKDRRYA